MSYEGTVKIRGTFLGPVYKVNMKFGEFCSADERCLCWILISHIRSLLKLKCSSLFDSIHVSHTNITMSFQVQNEKISEN